MRIIPAIDIRKGKVVRLIQGAVELETVYSDSPLDMAKKWASYGVETIHIVDLDGAIEGSLKNFDIVKDIAKNVGVKIELGGGIRDEETIDLALNAGIHRVVVGTKALDDDFLSKVSKRYADKIIIGIDAKHGIVHTRGWLFKTGVTAIELVKKVGGYGIKTINYTDISKDGTLEGPNLDSLKELLRSTSMEIVASGGVSGIEDLRKLCVMEKDGLKGIIIGKALYENKIDLKEAIKVCSQKG